MANENEGKIQVQLEMASESACVSVCVWAYNSVFIM